MSAEQDREPALSQASIAAGAVFLSYASEDAAAAERIAVALRSAGIQVWFDREELRGGDTWDRQIRQQIFDCRLFIAIVSAHTEARDEGYFRREWRLAVERAGDMAEGKAFLVPVVIDGTTERGAAVPDKFRELQWTRLPDGETSLAFVERLRRLLSPQAPSARAAMPASPKSTTLQPSGRSVTTHRRLKAGLWVPGAVLAVALTYFFADRFWLSKRTASSVASTTVSSGSQSIATPEKSIAVLPFVDLSEKHDQEYFADGMAEETLNQLAKIPGLKVIGRTSSFQFKGKSDDLRKIGTTLGAAYVLEGSVRRAGDQLRVTAQLIDTREGSHRWSETYDRSVADALSVQNAIAASLGRALEIEVAPLSNRGGHSTLKNHDAYDAYLLGLHAANRADQEGMEEAIAHYHRALELDPSFVPAAEQLAVNLESLAAWHFVAPEEGYAQTRKAAQAVIRLDPQSAVGHAVLGEVHTVYDWDWAAADREFKTALALSPNDPDVLDFVRMRCLAVGEWTQGVALTHTAGAVDPLSPNVFADQTLFYERLGRISEAEDAVRRLLAISPTYSWGHYSLGVLLLLEGKPEQALAEMQKETSAYYQTAGLALVYHALHRPRELEATMHRLEADFADVGPMRVAEAFAFQGKRDQAMAWLERAYMRKDSSLFLVKGDPPLKNLEGDPRYKAFLRKMNLPE
jgi:TolB-like protein